MNLNNQTDKKLFVDALKRFEVTEKELNDAFWISYSDPYVPSSGAEFRHLWKHIEKMRNGSGDKLYSYKEVLSICDKQKISTDHFDFIEKDKWRRK